MAGRSSLSGLLAYGNANDIVMEMAAEVLPVVRHTPILAGVNGTDPFRLMPQFLDEIQAAGFAGVQNFPTIGLIDGVFRANLEETGIRYEQEVDMIRFAHSRDLLTTPYVFDEQQAQAMTDAGADIIVAHMGLTTSGSIGAHTAMSLVEAAERTQGIADAARSVRPEVLCICHGGPIATPEDARLVLDNTTGIDGFYGASSIERLPTEIGIQQQTESFTSLRLTR
jgi:predicted TIM-barrel enzyme